MLAWRCCRRPSSLSTRPTPGPRRRPRSRAGTSSGSGCGRTRWTSPDQSLETLADACAQLDIHCAIGVNERESERPGSLYNALLLIGPGGLLAQTPQADADHAGAALPRGRRGRRPRRSRRPRWGRLGGLICWENMMPLARYAVYRGGPQIWLAPTADDSDGWLASMRHIAIESGAFVVSAPQFIPASAFPSDFPVPLPEDKDVFGNGGAAIVEPSEGMVVAGPALRRGGHGDRRLRPSHLPACEALVRRRGPLQPRGRPGALGRRSPRGRPAPCTADRRSRVRSRRARPASRPRRDAD